MSNSNAMPSGSAGASSAQHATVSSQNVSSPTAAAVNPAALGLAAFALTTFVLSFGNAGIIPAGAVPVVFSLALFYGGAIQVLAGLWEFAQKNTFGGAAFCSYGAFWMSFWYLNTATNLGKAGTGLAVGIGTWLATELAEDGDRLFGLAQLNDAPELGSFSLQELTTLDLPFGMHIERDVFFAGTFPISAYAETARETGSITAAIRILSNAARARREEGI